MKDEFGVSYEIEFPEGTTEEEKKAYADNWNKKVDQEREDYRRSVVDHIKSYREDSKRS